MDMANIITSRTPLRIHHSQILAYIHGENVGKLQGLMIITSRMPLSASKILSSFTSSIETALSLSSLRARSETPLLTLPSSLRM
jgi:hypothetical protein